LSVATHYVNKRKTGCLYGRSGFIAEKSLLNPEQNIIGLCFPRGLSRPEAPKTRIKFILISSRKSIKKHNTP
ncbi:hypothetical protein, partial [Pseudomonas aeruginosa]|uniref:hypothetical protein n=1 Tax=Pseudomonas aeruginosa TaxID=287 RepID=UPI003D27BF85